VRPYLLDINVLIALCWPSHVHHSQAQWWFANKQGAGFRTCPLTQIGFVRISSNKSFHPDALSPPAAFALMNQIVSLPSHGFWPDTLSLEDVIAARLPIVGHKQIVDAYLIALARSRDGTVATLDRAMLSMGADEGLVELVR